MPMLGLCLSLIWSDHLPLLMGLLVKGIGPAFFKPVARGEGG